MDLRRQSQPFPKIGVNSWRKNFLKEKGIFLGPNVSEKGMFSKVETTDMSYIIVLSEGAGIHSPWCDSQATLLKEHFDLARETN